MDWFRGRLGAMRCWVGAQKESKTAQDAMPVRIEPDKMGGAHRSRANDDTVRPRGPVSRKGCGTGDARELTIPTESGARWSRTRRMSGGRKKKPWRSTLGGLTGGRMTFLVGPAGCNVRSVSIAVRCGIVPATMTCRVLSSPVEPCRVSSSLDGPVAEMEDVKKR
jgi:hypothetical protein